MPSSEAFLSVDSVSMTFSVSHGREQRTIEVLEDISFDVGRGEFCCVIGPSGCGKSTLLRICDGLIDPVGGQVSIEGKAVTSPNRDVGVVFQSFNLFPWRTVVENVELGLESMGVEKHERRERAHRWIKRVGLDGFANFYPGQISGGMQQRVGLARALAIEPDILLMDEPFGSLDAQTRLIMQSELSQLWAENKKTVIFVTHDIEEALYLADRVHVLSSRPGRLTDTIDVPFPRPRDRGDPDFARLKAELWEQLRVGVNADHAGGGFVDTETTVDTESPGQA